MWVGGREGGDSGAEAEGNDAIRKSRETSDLNKGGQSKELEMQLKRRKVKGERK